MVRTKETMKYTWQYRDEIAELKSKLHGAKVSAGIWRSKAKQLQEVEWTQNNQNITIG